MNPIIKELEKQYLDKEMTKENPLYQEECTK